MDTQDRFKPAWWLPGGHLQTLWPSLKKRKIDIPLTRERLWLPDGDFVDLDWISGNERAPLVLILHGLEGSIESSYAKGMLKALKNAGFSALLMHFRGCSGEHNKKPSLTMPEKHETCITSYRLYTSATHPGRSL